MFKVENLVDNLAFWLSFIRELVDTLLPPPVQYPLKKDLLDVQNPAFLTNKYKENYILYTSFSNFLRARNRFSV